MTRRILPIVLVLALAMAACSSGGSDRSAKSSDAKSDSSSAPVELKGDVNDEGTKDLSKQGADATVTIELGDSSFSPTYLQAAPDAAVKVTLKNQSSRPHTFTLDDGSINQQIEPGKDATVTVTMPHEGDLPFHCEFHQSMGMQGAFYVA